MVRGHPWIFSGAIKKDQKKPAEGSLVRILSEGGKELGIGFYSSRGSIAVKMLSNRHKQLNEEFWHERISAAYGLRKLLGLVDSAETDAYRLVNAEGDFVPGLIIDWYAGTAVLQIQNPALEQCLSDIAAALKSVIGVKLRTLYYKSYDAEASPSRYLFGEASAGLVRENGKQFHIDWERGQKTGFFLDQRENRALLGSCSQEKRVLNAFCYTGGFSIYALDAGATSVVSLDTSKPALQVLEENIRLNGGSERHTTVCDDFFRFMQNLTPAFDIIVLDPPAFAKDRRAVKSGIKGYRSINEAAFRNLPPGGLLFTFSCSQLVSRNDFREAVLDGAAAAGRTARILRSLQQAPCHPVYLGHPEGEYLKGLLLHVD